MRETKTDSTLFKFRSLGDGFEIQFSGFWFFCLEFNYQVFCVFLAIEAADPVPIVHGTCFPCIGLQY